MLTSYDLIENIFKKMASIKTYNEMIKFHTIHKVI